MVHTEQDYWKASEVARLLSMMEGEKRYFQELIALLPVAVAVVTREGEFVSTNRAFRRLFGLGSVDVYEMGLDGLGVAGLAEAMEKLGGGEAAAVVTGETGEEDRQRSVRCTLIRFQDWEERQPPEALLVVEDVTMSRQEALEQAGEQAAQLRAQLEKLPVTPWETALIVPEAALADRVDEAHLAAVKAAYQTGIRVAESGEARVFSCDYCAKGRREVWLRDVVRIEGDRAYGITLDITDSRLREQAAAQTGKVDALSRMAGKVVHDCNNLLMITGGYGEELLAELPAGSPLRPGVEEILEAGRRLSKLTEQLAEYVRHPSPEQQPFLPDALLCELRDDMARSLPAEVELVVSCRGEGLWASGEAALVVHAVKTLVQRAADSISGSGRIAVGVSPAELTAASAGNTGPAPGSYVRIVIHDEGHAIHRDILARLFEPAFTADLARYGLPAMYKSVREMGGWITGESSAEHGTEFCIWLPRAEAPSPAPQVAAEPSVSTVESVLIVEDEAGIRTLMRRVLDREGYTLMEAGHGRAALELARNHPGPIDLLVTDVVMPEMNGFELARALRAIRPDLKVLFISGYTGLSSFDPAQLSAGSAFLQKPFTLNAFVAKVRELLEA
jgi:CheY-like chemotaxis protein